MAGNLNAPYSQGLLKLPQLGPEMIPSSLKDSSVICIARGSPKLSKLGPEVDRSPNDLYAICITKTRQDPSLSP